MSKEKFHPKVPAFLCAKIVFEFYNNSDSDYKNNSLKMLCKGLRKEFNISATHSEEQIIDNPESGSIVLALTSVTLSHARSTYDKALAYIDEHSQGRIVESEHREEEFS